MVDEATPQGTILIVDDNPTNLQVLLDALEGEGFERLVATDGEMAIDQAKYAQPDIILLDVMMPGIDGYETCRRLKKSAVTRDIPVIFMTALSSVDQKLTGFEAGAVDYVTKPLKHQEVIARVNTHLTIFRLQRQLKDAYQRLKVSEERFSLALSGARDGIWDWNISSDQIYFSPRWYRMLGIKTDEQPSNLKYWLQKLHTNDRDFFNKKLNDHLTGKTPYFEIECRIQHQNDQFLWVLIRGIATKDKQGQAYRMAGSQTDISENKLIDPLTGLPNKLLFCERLTRVQQKDQSFAVIMLDIDRFKAVNDSLSTRAADRILIEFAHRIQTQIEQFSDARSPNCQSLLARLEADRFLVLVEQIAQEIDLEPLIDALNNITQKHFNNKIYPIHLSASIGIVIYLSCASNASQFEAEEIIKQAEIAIHTIKQTHPGDVQVFDHQLAEKIQQRLQLEADLWRAIEAEQFELYYQPIVSIASGRVTSCEALIRWNHPHRGLVPPDSFIPVAEEINAILPIGEWAIRQACLQKNQWRSLGFEDLTIAVNVSVKQLLQQGFTQLVTSILNQTGAKTSDIKLEITESIAIQNLDFAVEILRKLDDMGIQISMDDFGTGYSSLSYLARLAVKFLKIDKTFVDELDAKKNGIELVTPILAMAQSLNLKVIAEGVETIEQLNFLRQAKCDELQGYFFNRPVPANEFTQLLVEGKHLTPQGVKS